MAQKRRSSAGGNFPGLSGEHAAKLRKVIKVLQNSEYHSEMSKSVREMLSVGAAEAVRFESQERHAAQTTICTYIQDSLASLQSQQKQILDEEKAAQSQDGPKLQELESKLALADTEIEKAAAVVEMRKLGLAEAQRVLTEAKSKLAEENKSKAAPSAAKATLDKLSARYSEFSEGPLKTILDGTWDDEKAAKTASKQVMDEVLVMDDMEEAFLVAMPGALAKRQSERSSFDTMVLTTLQGKIADRSTALAAKIAEAQATLATHDAEVEKRTKVVEESTKSRDNAEAELREAETQKASATEARLGVKVDIDQRTEASVNRETALLQAEVNIETLEETANDFKYLVERSAAAEKAAAAAAAAEAAAAEAAAAEAAAAEAAAADAACAAMTSENTANPPAAA